MNAQKERYINPLTDFGFKKLFGKEPKEREAYEESLKYSRDLKNVVDTAREEGRAEAQAEVRMERSIEIAKTLKESGIAIEVIIQSTGLSKKEIEKL